MPASAPAATDQETQFQDDTLLVFRSPAEVARTLDTLRSLGVDRIRVSLFWSLVAPNPGGSGRPSFNAADPSAYPQDGWRRYDLIDELATARGIAVNWDLVPPTPQWASTKSGDPNLNGHYYPNPQEYARWVQQCLVSSNVGGPYGDLFLASLNCWASGFAEYPLSSG